jgi:aspartyl-tRNA(Asn)/glutamyl-tRNA(Gln) amidotransferase subunit C
MQVDDALIDKLSRLSALRFGAEEREGLKNDLQKMIGFIDKLSELDTAGVPPLLHMSGNSNVLRDDEVFHPITKEQALQNAPRHDEQFIKVPKVIRKNEQS